jgi:hypothetical protein
MPAHNRVTHSQVAKDPKICLHSKLLVIRENMFVKVLRTSRRLIEVHVDAFELKIRVSVVRPGRVDSVLITNNFPEFGSDLVAALASLNVDDLTHLESAA